VDVVKAVAVVVAADRTGAVGAAALAVDD